MHEVLVNRLGGLSLSRKSVVRSTDHPDMTLDVYRGRKTTIQPTNQHAIDDNMEWNRPEVIIPLIEKAFLQECRNTETNGALDYM